MLAESSKRTHTAFQGFSYSSFSADLLKRQSKRLCFHFGRDHDNSVDVTEENIAGPHRYTFYFDWNSEVVNLVARRGILTVRSETKGGISDG